MTDRIMPMPRPTSISDGTSSGLKINRMSSRNAATPVMASRISGHGACSCFEYVERQQHRDDGRADDEKPRDRAGEEEVEDVPARAAEPGERDRHPLEEAEDEEADGPADHEPVRCLELAEVHPYPLLLVFPTADRSPDDRRRRATLRDGRRSVDYGRGVPTALLSVYDKSGIVEFARSLDELGWDLVSSGGTARAIADAGIAVTDVAELTGLPAILGHRVVTLHPTIHGGILADPTDPEHVADMEHHGISPIDLVVVNLYPFSSDPGIQLIDIGGPAMVRAAAKNHAFVGIVVDPADYAVVLDELRADGALGRGHPPSAGTHGVRPHRVLRRRHRHLVRRDHARRSRDRRRQWSARRRSTSRWSWRSRCGTARTRTSRAPAIGRPGRPAGGTR